MKIALPIHVFCAVIVTGFSGLAQSPAPAPAFEAATVRPADPAAGYLGPRVRTSPGSLTIHGSSLRDCIQIAYQMPQAQVTGPDWLNDVRLDITAKAAGPADEQQLYRMLQTLLAERLGVKTHIEKKETPVYALTIAKGGPKFSESATQGPPSFGQDKSGLFMQRVAMSELAMLLSQEFRRPVVDATGLKSRYDIHLNMSSYVAAENAGGQPATPEDGAGMMITALQEQLGIKVESRKNQVEILIVDHAEKTPGEN